MPYGSIKVDNIIFTNGGVDQAITVSGIVASTSGNLTATGTISGNIIRGGTTVSGATVTGSAGQFGNLTAVSGTFTTISGGTYTLTSGVFASGTAANPSISFVSDPNTGIYSPGADQVAISTNGTGRLFVDSGGGVGINVANPATRLDVNGNTRISGGGIRALGYYLDNTSAYNVTLGTTGNVGYLQAVNVGNLSQLSIDGSPIVFRVGSYSEAMRLDSSGRLGIGTASPAFKLHVAGGGNGGAIRAEDTSASAILYVNPAFATGVPALHTGSAHPLAFAINTTEVARFDTSGRLGLGTSSPQQELHINDATGVSRIRLTGGAVGTDNFEIGQAIPGVSNSGFSIYDVDATASRFVIDSSGNVGIGTTSPGTPFHVSADGTELRVQTTNNSNFPSFQFRSAGGGTYGGLSFDPNGASALIFTNGAHTERARIDGSGRLLVGTSSSIGSNERIQSHTTSGDNFGIGRFSADNGGADIAFYKSRSGTVGTNTALQSGDGLGTISFKGADGSSYGQYAWIQAFVDATPGTNDYPARLTFSTTADGASSPTERMRITSAGDVGVAKGLSVGGITGVASRIYFDGTVIQSGAGNSTLKYNTSSGVLTYDTSSRLVKDQIIDCPYGINEIKQLQPRKYFRTDDQRDEIGFVADELVNVLPEFVPIGPKSVITKNEDDTDNIPLGVSYEKLTAVLTKALQEAIAKIEVLEAKVAALEPAAPQKQADPGSK